MYQLEWIQAALDDIATVWIQAGSELRQAITDAAYALEQELQTDPFQRSESRGDDERVTFAYPLAALIEVDQEPRLVWILHVWQFRRRGSPSS